MKATIHHLRTALRHNEEGHAIPLLGALVGAAGAVVLGIGAANGSGAAAIAGGIIAALGFILASVLHHGTIDWEVYRRLDDLEKKK